MSKVSQKQSVVNEIKAILGGTYNENIPARDQLTEDQLKTVKANVVAGILNGSIEFKTEYSDEKDVIRYVSGMVSNHLRKARELNGNVNHSPLSSGRGSRDPQISELTKLLKTYSDDSEEYKQVIIAINARKTELTAEKNEQAKATKKQKVSYNIDFSVLPEGLQHLAQNLIGEASPE